MILIALLDALRDRIRSGPLGRGATNLSRVIECLIEDGELADIKVNKNHFDIIPVPVEALKNDLGFIKLTDDNFIGQIAASVSMGNKVALDFGRITFDSRRVTNLSGKISFANGMFDHAANLQSTIGLKIWEMSGKDIRINHVVDNCHYYVVIEPLNDHNNEDYRLVADKGNGILVFYS